MKELVINFWFIVDIGTDICQHFYVKVYHMEGEDQFKFNLLRTLAESDYITCERQDVPDNFKVVYPNREVKGIPVHKLNELFQSRMEQFIQLAESSLPKLLKFDPYGGSHKAVKQVIPQDPLYVMTLIFENEVGEQRAFTTEENQEWIKEEKMRMI